MVNTDGSRRSVIAHPDNISAVHIWQRGAFKCHRRDWLMTVVQIADRRREIKRFVPGRNSAASFKRTSVQKRTRDEEQRKKYRSCSAGARELLTLLFYFQFYRCGHHSPRSTAHWWLMRTKFFSKGASRTVLSWKRCLVWENFASLSIVYN